VFTLQGEIAQKVAECVAAKIPRTTKSTEGVHIASDIARILSHQSINSRSSAIL
jgi:hypothetical protein